MVGYKDSLTEAMVWLGSLPDTIFLGQCVKYKGNAMFDTLKDIPEDKRLEMPVAEELQMGMSIGISLAGLTPISCYPRFDFLLLAMNQMVNHLDKISSMTCFRPKVIIRTMVGPTYPLNGGLQHTGDYTDAMKAMLKTIRVRTLFEPGIIPSAYEDAYWSDTSTLLIEYGERY